MPDGGSLTPSLRESIPTLISSSFVPKMGFQLVVKALLTQNRLNVVILVLPFFE